MFLQILPLYGFSMNISKVEQSQSFKIVATGLENELSEGAIFNERARRNGKPLRGGEKKRGKKKRKKKIKNLSRALCDKDFTRVHIESFSREHKLTLLFTHAKKRANGKRKKKKERFIYKRVFLSPRAQIAREKSKSLC